MATLMAIAPLPDRELLDALTAPRPPLRLLSNPGESRRAADPGAHFASALPAGRPQPGWSAARRARLRRTGLFVLVIGLLGALAVPVSALAGTGATTTATLTQGSTYVVQPGDTLWSIATRLDPTGDPRSIVGQLASETGSDTVVVGEHIRLP
jgi:nucleoid-associated protein YgaU